MSEKILNHKTSINHEYQLLASSDAKERKVLKVTVYLVIGNVLQISIIGLSNNANEISNID